MMNQALASTADYGLNLGCCEKQKPPREKTAREVMTQEREDCLTRAALLKARMDTLDARFGKSLLETPQSEYQKMFDLYGHLF